MIYLAYSAMTKSIAFANQDVMTVAIIKPQKPVQPDIDPREAYIAYMFAAYLCAPGRKTVPGEPVDLGEIGECREKNWNRLTPYSPSEPLR